MTALDDAPATITPRNPLFWMTSPGNTPKGDRRDFYRMEETEWTDWLMPGTRYKLLYCNLVSGAFTILLQVDPNIEATSHWHVGNLQVYILDGGFYYYDGTVTIDGERIEDRGTPDSFTVETAGTIHQPFATDTGCLMLAVFDGPIGGYTEDGQLAVMGDARLHYYMAKDNDAVHNTQLVDYSYGSTDLQ
ncbi:cupin domain-containing protein [Gordonia sp. NPDC003424]